MNIYVYWNTNDLDSKKIFHFLSKEDEFTIIPSIEEKSIDRHWQPFKKRGDVEKKIEMADVVIFCTHGAPNEILKYQPRPNHDKKEYVLIDSSNIGILEGKKVLAFCCDSAKMLGPLSVSGVHKSQAYIGFNKPIVYDDGFAPQTKNRVYVAYKKAFRDSLEYAIRTRCTVKEYKSILWGYIQKEMVAAALQVENGTLNNVYITTLNGLVALGDVDIPLFID